MNISLPKNLLSVNSNQAAKLTITLQLSECEVATWQ